MERKGNLTNADHSAMDRMLLELLVAVQNGSISERAAASGLAHVIAAVDIDNMAEARQWFAQENLAFFRETHDGLKVID